MSPMSPVTRIESIEAIEPASPTAQAATRHPGAKLGQVTRLGSARVQYDAQGQVQSVAHGADVDADGEPLSPPTPLDGDDESDEDDYS